MWAHVLVFSQCFALFKRRIVLNVAFAVLVCAVHGAHGSDPKDQTPTSPMTWAFGNGAVLTFVHDEGVFFTPTTGTKRKLIAGKVRQHPGGQNKSHKGTFTVYKPNFENVKLVFVQVDEKMVVVNDSGKTFVLPLRYDRISDPGKQVIYWSYLYNNWTHDKNWTHGSTSIQFLALTLAYDYPEKIDELRKKSSEIVDFLNTGETYLIREDGVFVRVDDRLHQTINGSLGFVDGLFQFLGSAEGRRIDLRHFDREAQFIVPYTLPADSHEGRKVDPEKYVLSFATNLSDQVRAEKVRYEPLDEETRDHLRRAFIKKELGSAVVLGPAGSGKTETVKRLVAEVAEGKIPEIPRSVVFLSLDPASLGSGTRFTGNFESKVQAMIVASQMRPIVWVLDEVHSLQGQGTHSENPNDVFQMLKPHLSSGKIKVIGMSTKEEFFRAFSHDIALLERFQVIEQAVPTPDEAIARFAMWARKHGRPVPEEAVLRRLYQLSEELYAVGAQPRKGIALLSDAFADLEMKGESQRAPTLQDIEASARRIYRLDRDHFNYEAIREKIRQLPRRLDQAVVGQKGAKTALLRQATSSLLGTHDPSKPRMSIFMAGPKGVGKTDLAHAYADAVGFPLVRIVMSRFSVHDQPTDLLREIKQALEKNAFTVFLLDEFEKAPRRMMDALLSIFDKGRFTLPEHSHSGAVVRSADVSATLASFILAGNSAINFASAGARMGFQEDLRSGERASESEALREALAKDGVSEFLIDRIQDCVFMGHLTRSEFREVVEMHFRKIVDEQSARHGVTISIEQSERFLAWVTDIHYRSDLSNRAVLRVLQSELRYALAQGLLSGEKTSPQGLRAVFEASDSGLRFVDCSKQLESSQKPHHSP